MPETFEHASTYEEIALIWKQKINLTTMTEKCEVWNVKEKNL